MPADTPAVRLDDGPTRRLGFVAVCVLVAATAILAAAAFPGSATVAAQDTTDTVTEEPYVQHAPEKGDEYYEISSEEYYPEDEQDQYEPWISYSNPRDLYRDPAAGDGSGKICVTLLNERGEVVEGAAVPDTRVVVETGEVLRWHDLADPFVVEFPLTEHYDEQPYDADQFGTSDDLPQGDGYMDAHCLEFHWIGDNATVEYGEPRIEGAHADGIDVVGYVQQERATWDTDVDPVSDAEPYEAVGGNWTMAPGSTHGQVVIVLQLDPEGVHEDYRPGGDDDGLDTASTGTPTSTRTPAPVGTDGDVDDSGAAGWSGADGSNGASRALLAAGVLVALLGGLRRRWPPTI